MDNLAVDMTQRAMITKMFRFNEKIELALGEKSFKEVQLRYKTEGKMLCAPF